ncbi:MoaD/ThiS family protein [Desulfonatronospira sp.]|uniref:MoaD/ThiS family protein n=1 Tax=Desulfonatronospira sp. TaxID=1962951 RepID=UPI0025BCB3D9|nr:MoaD/ThiS family protein [Desulfonatronospira sp.]
MQIQVSCYATLARFTPQDGTLEVEQGSTARDLIRYLQVPEDDVKIIFINGKSSDPDNPLNDQDRVGIFPAVGGG